VRRTKAVGLVFGAVLFSAGCSAGATGPSSPSGSPGPLATASFGPPFPVTGNARSGASPALALEGGYQIRWTITPDKPGCTFHLSVAASAGGPSVVDLGEAVLPGKAVASGSASFSVASGRYFIQAGRTDPLACKAGWTAMLQAQLSGPP
jgi:hypothetical protein